jgi:tripartite-type tricarboxylate transporter receptor subunit TctC
MKWSMQHFAAAVPSAVMLVAASGPAPAAEAYPAKPIRLIVGFAAGGANDLVARTVATRLSPRLGQQVVVENRAGASGNIATEFVSRAAPDGHTMLLASVASFAMSPALLGKVPFDPVADFAPVTQGVWVTSVLATHPSMPVRTLRQLVALAKKAPGKLNYASPGTGSIAHLGSELLFHTAGIKLNHVPYKGGAPAAADAIAGHVEAIYSLISTLTPHIRSARLRGLVVSSARRSTAIPDVPTVAESGYPGFEASGWLGFAFPAKTPKVIVDRLNREIVAVLQMKEVDAQLSDLGMDPEPTDPARFHALIKSDFARWAKVVREAGLKAGGE